MAAKRPKLERPSMDMLREEKEQEKSVVSEVKDHLKVLKEAKVQDLSVRRLKKLTEEKITWLLAAYGIRTICSVYTVMRSLPVGMTSLTSQTHFRLRKWVWLARLRNDTRPANKGHYSPSKCHGERGNLHGQIHY